MPFKYSLLSEDVEKFKGISYCHAKVDVAHSRTASPTYMTVRAYIYLGNTRLNAVTLISKTPPKSSYGNAAIKPYDDILQRR